MQTILLRMHILLLILSAYNLRLKEMKDEMEKHSWEAYKILFFPILMTDHEIKWFWSFRHDTGACFVIENSFAEKIQCNFKLNVAIITVLYSKCMWSKSIKCRP